MGCVCVYVCVGACVSGEESEWACVMIAENVKSM